MKEVKSCPYCGSFRLAAISDRVALCRDCGEAAHPDRHNPAAMFGAALVFLSLVALVVVAICRRVM